MLIHVLVVLTIAIAFMGLVVHEKNINLLKPVEEATKKGFVWLGENSYLGAVIKKGIKAHKADIKKQKLEEYKAFLEKSLKEAGVKVNVIWGGDYSWSPVSVEIPPESLHDARRVLRLTLGSWNDTIEPGSCEENCLTKKFELAVSYQPKEDLQIPTVIRTKYDLDSLPKGLLKEGCRVEKETTTRVTCSIHCEAA